MVEIARLYTGQGVYLEDLIGEGNVAVTLGTGMLGCLEKPSEAQGMLARMVMDAMEELIEENRESGKVDKKVESQAKRCGRQGKRAFGRASQEGDSGGACRRKRHECKDHQ